MNRFTKLILAFVLSFIFIEADSKAFELEAYKEVRLPTFPLMKVPIYKSRGKKGPGILFVHGNSASSRTFILQKLSRLGRTHKLYFMDLPGFGKASKVSPFLPFPELAGIPLGFPQYQVGMAEAIARVANDPDVNAKVIVGWSLGGDLTLLTYGLGLLPQVKGLMIYGSVPTGSQAPANEAPFLPPYVPGFSSSLSILASFGLAFQLTGQPPLGFSLNGEFTDPVPSYAPAPISLANNTGDAFLRAFFNKSRRLDGNVPSFMTEDAFDRSDSRARGSLGAISLGLTSTGPITFPDTIQVLQNLPIPVAILHGKEDAFINGDYLKALKDNGQIPTLWRDKIVEFRDTGHAIHYERPIRFNRVLKSFINDL